MVINMVLYNNILIIICFYIALYVFLTLSSLFHSNGQRVRRYDSVNTVSGVPRRFQCMSLMFYSISVRKNVAVWTIGNEPKMVSNWNNYDSRIEQWKSTAEYSRVQRTIRHKKWANSFTLFKSPIWARFCHPVSCVGGVDCDLERNGKFIEMHRNQLISMLSQNQQKPINSMVLRWTWLVQIVNGKNDIKR